MKTAQLWLALVLILPACSQAPEFEASMNFDLANVRPFLTDLENSLELGLDIEELSSFVQSVPIDEEVSMDIDVSFEGATALLRLTVYMDDYDAPDLYFFSRNEKLSKAIQEQMIGFAEARGL